MYRIGRSKIYYSHLNHQVTVNFVFMKPAAKLSLRAAGTWPPAGKSPTYTFRTLFIFFALWIYHLPSFAQDTTITQISLEEIRREDTIPVPPTPTIAPGLTRRQINRRVKLVAAANVLSYGGGMVALYHAWYKDYPQSKFHVFNDIKEWQQMDKIGHVFSAYAESKASMEFWRWSGIDRKKRIWIGGMSGAIYQTSIEILDGFSAEWGWSWGDFGANILGSGMLVAQELAWDRQKIQMKWSFHRKKYSDASLNNRSDALFGKSNPERFLKDYNGQTYWLSGTLRDFFPKSKLPAWLQVSVGTGAEGMFGGFENLGKDENGNIIFDRRDIKRYRQWYLAPDIDLTKIKTNKKGIKLALQVLNIFKFPTPSVELSRGKLFFNWLHF